jgi:hypothetical protein
VSSSKNLKYQQKETPLRNTYMLSPKGIPPVATLSKATGNEVFGSVILSPALLTDRCSWLFVVFDFL